MSPVAPTSTAPRRAAPGPLAGQRVAVVSGSTLSAARSACAELGADAVLILERRDLLTSPLALRARARAARVDAGIIFSSDWSRQELPQLLLLALTAAALGRRRYLVEGRPGAAVTIRMLPRSAAWTVPSDVVRGAALLGRETMRAPLAIRGGSGRTRVKALPSSVIAFWIGAPDSPVGGSVTHASGILGGLRACGVRVGLVTAGALPEQLEPVVDEVEFAGSLSRAGRITSDIERIVSDRAIRQAGIKLAHRLPPGFVYQRHRPFLGAGLELARSTSMPFALEWNSSEVWVRRNWNTTVGVERVFDRMLAASERRILRSADVVVAVSEPAAQMALRCGAESSRVTIVPNGVNVAEIERLTRGVQVQRPEGARAVIGWIGSFGPWHGAPVLVRALARLDPDVFMLMIGDGQELRQCQRLATELGIGARIEWTGAVPHEQAVRRLRACDVLASPHVQIPGERFFGSPTKIFEYMAIGRPIVASGLEQIDEVLENHRTAKLVTPGDEGELAAAIEAILAAPDLGAALGKAARRAVGREHNWEQRAADVLRALERCGLRR